MKQEVHIQFHGMEASEALEASARAHARKLDAFATDIMACRVVIDLEQKHKQQGRPFGVRIDLTLPGHELVVNRVHHEDVYVALRDAFDDMRRQLQELVRQRRGDEKAHPVPLHGELARLRPAPRHLTRFYLMLSAGGALGGIAVPLLALTMLVT